MCTFFRVTPAQVPQGLPHWLVPWWEGQQRHEQQDECWSHSYCQMRPKQLSQGRSFPFKTLMIIDIHPPLDRIGTITQSVLASWHRLVPPPVLNEKIMQKCKFWCGPSFATFAQCLKPLSWWNAGLSPTFNILTDDFRFLWRIWT